MSEKEDERYDLDEGKSEDDVVINYCTTTRCLQPRRRKDQIHYMAGSVSVFQRQNLEHRDELDSMSK